MKTVLITGGSGLIGKYLSQKLKENGYTVTILSRKAKKNIPIPYHSWNLEKGEIDSNALHTADYIVHLAGANIGKKRWTTNRKQLIVNSRVKTGKLIYESIKKQKEKIKAFISASAVGYYGAITSSKVFTENDLPGTDFLGKTCRQWEQTTEKFEELGIRTVKIRTALVLTKRKGALSKMMIPIKLGLGATIGNGHQYVPWIHIDDLCNIYIKAIADNKMSGSYNAVAPEHITNKTFTQSLAQVLKKPLWLPSVPSMLMKLIFGEMADLILKGSRVSSVKIRETTYDFLFPTLKSALIDLIKNDV